MELDLPSQNADPRGPHPNRRSDLLGCFHLCRVLSLIASSKIFFIYYCLSTTLQMDCWIFRPTRHFHLPVFIGLDTLTIFSGGSRKLGTGGDATGGGHLRQNQILAVCTERSTGKSPPPYQYGSERGGGARRERPPPPKSAPVLNNTHKFYFGIPLIHLNHAFTVYGA